MLTRCGTEYGEYVEYVDRPLIPTILKPMSPLDPVHDTHAAQGETSRVLTNCRSIFQYIPQHPKK